MIDSQDVFIRQHQVAFEAGMTLTQFAQFLNILPESVTRRRNKIRQEYGVVLQALPTDNNNTDVTMPDSWKDVLYDPMVRVDHSNKGTRRIVITSAQNATKVFKPFLNCLLKYCEEMDAELMVIPYRYRNPTSLWSANNENDDWWDASIKEYLVTDYIQICKSLQLFGPVKTQPTASNPLSGYDTVSGLDSAIFGHPRIQLLTIPTPSQKLPKILTTTGAITVENYTPTKTGFKGQFHHSLAALVVEVDDESEVFHVRHIHANEKTGAFYDLDKFCTTTKITHNNPIAGLVCGDSHAEFHDEKVRAATFTDPDSMVSVLNPPQIVLHDVEDFYRRNHHHRGDVFSAFCKQHFGRNNVEEGLQITADFIDSIPAGIKKIIVKSNHDEAFDRWLKESDPKFDPENAQFYHYMLYHCLKSVRMTDTGYTMNDPFKFWCLNPDAQRGLQNKDDVIFLARDEDYQICGIEVGFHGDRGPNGARGSAKSFAKIGPKTVIGHSHSPCIVDGVYQVGLSGKMNLEYVSGPSSWLQTHCIIYGDGKRTLINTINGKWKL
jgi:hypothetical protein